MKQIVIIAAAAFLVIPSCSNKCYINNNDMWLTNKAVGVFSKRYNINNGNTIIMDSSFNIGNLKAYRYTHRVLSPKPIAINIVVDQQGNVYDLDNRLDIISLSKNGLQIINEYELLNYVKYYYLSSCFVTKSVAIEYSDNTSCLRGYFINSIGECINILSSLYTVEPSKIDTLSKVLPHIDSINIKQKSNIYEITGYFMDINLSKTSICKITIYVSRQGSITVVNNIEVFNVSDIIGYIDVMPE